MVPQALSSTSTSFETFNFYSKEVLETYAVPVLAGAFTSGPAGAAIGASFATFIRGAEYLANKVSDKYLDEGKNNLIGRYAIKSVGVLIFGSTVGFYGELRMSDSFLSQATTTLLSSAFGYAFSHGLDRSLTYFNVDKDSKIRVPLRLLTSAAGCWIGLKITEGTLKFFIPTLMEKDINSILTRQSRSNDTAGKTEESKPLGTHAKMGLGLLPVIIIESVITDVLLFRLIYKTCKQEKNSAVKNIDLKTYSNTGGAEPQGEVSSTDM
ncbi:hypothetical protein D5R81_17750 [Parashewanella spongiae]|uniref:Uncharacterized protein n=1 Tax=Parashewanella spongiae TaxID=342950 RepID=A0A3A6TN90_9GAMM|nr:hypothetical protein [Parashewanella spongiae]MCL1079903.1 hypothetical protein [Parashewanella spongiae]RJY06457.1 hypothetical protein D5R81_17750 [Parashewanella spongiae]